jgi:energy-coupling factor transport system ATP-binding protein
VAIAGILAMEPEILILDEPTAGLDPVGQKEVLNLIKNFQGDSKTILLVSHDMDTVLEYATRVIVLKDGEIVADDKPSNVFQKAELLSEIGINLPVLFEFAMELNKNGYNIPLTIKTEEELVRHLVGEYNE